MRRDLGLFILLCACHAGTVKPIAQSGVQGTIHSISGDPLRDSVTVTVSSLPFGLEIAAMQTGPLGEFALDLAPGEYAFAATSATGFLFVDKLTVPTSSLSLRLSSDCHQVHGRVTGNLAQPVTLSLSRVSRYVGDKFITSVASDGRFSACLPKGTYSQHVEGAMASLEGPIVVPSDAVLDLVGYPAALLKQTPTDAHIAEHDLGSFVRSLHGRRIIGLGEANHGTGDFYTYRGKLSLELARSGELRSVLVEADAIAMLAIDDYVMGVSVDIAKAVTDIRFWITDIREFLAFLADVRTYNAAMPSARKLHVLGIDAQRLSPPVQWLLSHRAAFEISEAEADLLTQILPSGGEALLRLSADEQVRLSSLLDRLATSSRPMDLASDASRASIAARSVRSQLGYVGKAEVDRLRDLAMADLAAYIVGVIGPGQAVIWAHNGHVARQPDGPSKTLGQHLAERFGDAYYPIAFLSYRGEGRAWDEAGKIGVISHELTPAPPYNVESVVMNATGFADIAWVRFDTASGPLLQWLSLPRYVREFGSAYHPGHTQTLRVFPAAIAAVVVIQRATSSTPTPTGVRKVKQ